MMNRPTRASTIRFYSILLISYTIGFALLAFAVFTDQFNLPALDNAIIQSVHSEALPNGVSLFSTLTKFGLDWLWIAVVAGALLCLVRRNWLHLFIWLFTWAGGQLTNELIKAAFNRTRPVIDTPFLVAARASFPSGHAMMSTILYGFLAYLVLKRVYSTPLRALVITLTICWVGLIGFSRVYLGVHFPSDVIGGFLAGSAWLSLCIVLLETLEGRRAADHVGKVTRGSVHAASA
jgi:membrane-associated phospholipid phosphatase